MLDAIAHYKVLGPLGAGGLGEVYRARDTRVGRTVAVKVLPAAITQDSDRLRALLEAAKSASSVSHPNIAALFEVGEDAGRRFLVFEFVPGDPLNALIEGRALNVRRAVELAIQLADALADVEAADLAHGDIRPATIVVTSKDRAKLMNFGLAAFTAGGASRRTSSAIYVAPEAVAAAGDIRSDIFSLGAVLFEMLTGRQRGQGLAPSSLNKNVPPELDRIVGQMLASNVDHRYQSAATVAAELRSIAAILEARATAEEAAFGLPGRQRRGRSGTVVVLGVFAIVAAIGAWLWWTLAGR